MTDLITTGGQAVTMTSLEIAELVGSRHDDVKRSIERLVERRVIAQPPTADVQQKGGNNRTYTTQVYVFRGTKGKRDSLVVVAQLCPEFTAKLVDRWQELETQAAAGGFRVPSTRAEALRLAADLEEQNATLLLENQQQAERIHSLESLFTPGMTPVDFCKKLNGVNTSKVNAYLERRGWLYNESDPERSARWRVKSYARDRYLTEKIGKEVKTSVASFIPHTAQLLQAGAIRLYELYQKGDLPMKVDWNGSFTHVKFPAGAI
jgi:phage regulator Rha-like protein